MLKEIKTETEHFFIDKNRLKQGEYRDYHFNGQLWEHSFYLNNKRHGECKMYSIKAKLYRHMFFENGKRHGETKKYHDNGQLCEYAIYKNGIRHGVYERYYSNGELNYATFFFQGNDLNVNPDTLTERDKAYIMLSGRLPPRDDQC